MTWERQRAYDFDDGKEAGIAEGKIEGRAEKAIEAAVMLVKDYNATPEIAAQKMNAPLKLVLEALKKQTQNQFRNNKNAYHAVFATKFLAT